MRKQTAHDPSRSEGIYAKGGLIETSHLKEYGYKPYFLANVAMYGYAVGSPDLHSQQMEPHEEKGHRRTLAEINKLDYSSYLKK
jgi:hypothetical protein